MISRAVSGLKREIRTPIQIGENFMGPEQMAQALAAGACDYVMPDAERIGGVTGWMRAAALAQGAGVEMSSHLFPEVSCHLLAATPTCHWLEYVDWAEPILKEPVEVKDGFVQIPDRPGLGMEWDEKAVKQLSPRLMFTRHFPHWPPGQPKTRRAAAAHRLRQPRGERGDAIRTAHRDRLLRQPPLLRASSSARSTRSPASCSSAAA